MLYETLFLQGNLMCKRSVIEDTLSQVRYLNSRPAAYEAGALSVRRRRATSNVSP